MQPITYLCFNGNCGEAFSFYEKALNGKIEFSQTFGEAPMPTDDEHKDQIMHISLDTNGGKIYGSDAPGEHAGHLATTSVLRSTLIAKRKLIVCLLPSPMVVYRQCQ